MRHHGPGAAGEGILRKKFLATAKWAAVLAAAGASIAVGASTSAGAQGAKPQVKKPGTDTAGTNQMKGGDGLIGVIYTFQNNGLQLNAKLVSAEYSVARFNVAPGSSIIPKTGEKLLILHWQVKNPRPSDEYVSRDVIPFSTVAADGQTRNHTDYQRLANGKEAVALTIKPGQALPGELLAAGLISAQGSISKLIINFGRLGTSDKVTRYNIGKAPNIVKPLPAADADPADTTGATARTLVPAKIGVSYPLGYFDLTVDSIAFAPGPIGTQQPGAGKRFLVAAVTVTNRTWRQDYANNFLDASLLTADDEKTRVFKFLKGKRDEIAEGRQIDPDETVTYRLAFAVPNDTTGKTLTLAEIVDNSNHTSRALVFDLAGVK